MSNNEIFLGDIGWSGDDKFYSEPVGKDRTDYLKTVVEIKDGMKYTTHYIDRQIRKGDSVGGAIGSLINGVETITEIVNYVYKELEEPNIMQYPLTPDEVYNSSQDKILSPEVFIGICEKSPQGNTNKGHVWAKCNDGLYRSVTSEVTLTEAKIYRDLEHGYLKRLI